jgi:peptide/nickel transport system substrate-binding protein
MKRLLVFAVLVFVVLPTAFSMAQGPEETLIRALTGGDISTLNPALVSDSTSIDVSQFLWAGLFVADPNTGEPLPKLATWETSEDGLTYTFTISDAAVWSDGTPITAQDVEFTYNAILQDNIPSPRKADFDLVTGFNVIDDKTFEVQLSAPNCTVWGGAFSSLTPVPSHLYAADFSDFVDGEQNLNPQVTSGPYYVDEYRPGEYIRLAAHESYWDGEAARIPYILNQILADTAVQNQALLSGTVDYAFMYPDQLEQLGDTSNFNVFVSPLNNTPLFVMNWEDPAEPQAAYDAEGNAIEQTPNQFFSDVRVRQAIAMGYDKASIVGTLGPDGGYVLNGPFTPMFAWAQDPNTTGYAYDPEQAAALLDEAGWVDSDGDGIRDKDGVPFEFELVYSPLVDLWTNIALVAQDQLGQIGIKVNVTSMEWSAYLNDVLIPQKFDATIVGFGGGIEVDGIAYSILQSNNDAPGSGFNMASYVNPQVDELLAIGRTTVGCSQEERAVAYQELNRIVMEDVAYDFTVGTNQVNIMNSRITGYEPGPFNNAYQPETWGIGQ